MYLAIHVPASCPSCLSVFVEWVRPAKPKGPKIWFQCRSCDYTWSLAKAQAMKKVGNDRVGPPARFTPTAPRDREECGADFSVSAFSLAP